MARDAAELEGEVDEDHLVGPAQGRGTAMLVAMVVVPTPPLGLKTAIVRRARAIVRPSAEKIGPMPARPLEAQQQRLDPASSSRPSKGLAITSSAPASRKRDPLVDVVGLADAEDRDLGHRGRRAERLADLDGRHRPGHDVDDDQLVVRRLGDGVGGVDGRR